MLQHVLSLLYNNILIVDYYICNYYVIIGILNGK